jgi:hypothetical protein
MLDGIKKCRSRNKKIAELREYIDRVYAGELKDAKTPQEKGEAYQIAHSICEYEENELDFLRQEDILNQLKSAPFEVPKEYWDEGKYCYKTVLTYRGEIWARNELKKVRREEIEFWFKIVLPVIAIIISVIALVKSAKN